MLKYRLYSRALMKPRNFLNALSVGAAALTVYVSAYAQNPLLFPLTSKSYEGAEFNEQIAAKARKAAEYVITRDKQKGLLSFDSDYKIGRYGQGVKAEMQIDDLIYTIWVQNRDEAKTTNLDLISISMRPKDSHGDNKLIKVSDEGLDGICEHGVIPEGLSDNGQRIVYRFDSIEIFRTDPENKERFQILYRETLDNIIEFYERTD